MKKLAIICFALLLALLSLPALADQYPGVVPWTIHMIDSGTTDDFDRAILDFCRRNRRMGGV